MSRAARVGARLLAAALAGGAISPAASQVVLDEAQRAYRAGRFGEAHRLWAPRAEAGDAQAQLGLGVLYDVGQGVARDPALAYRWYRRAAEAGLAEAQFNVAVMHDTGDAVPRDLGAAALWYARAAAHGNRRAQYNLAQLYETGQGLPRNPDQAEVWYAMAAADLPAAADRLAALRRRGPGRGAGRDATRDSGAGPGRPGGVGMLVAAEPVAPAAGGRVERRGGSAAVELVWTAPAQPVPARFFVQLWVLDEAGPREAFAAYLDESATLAPLERSPGHYAWRVYAVDRDAKHYAASAWNRFTVEPPHE